MNIQTSKWKEYLKQDVIGSSYELGCIIGLIYDRAIVYWGIIKKSDKFSIAFPSKKQDQKKTFEEELEELLICKKDEMPDVKISDKIFKKLSNELYKLLSCSLVSNRTPDEIVTGLKDDITMRKEVVDLVINETKAEVSCNEQRVFLDRIFSGDNDLKVLLNKQLSKKGFPYNI